CRAGSATAWTKRPWSSCAAFASSRRATTPTARLRRGSHGPSRSPYLDKPCAKGLKWASMLAHRPLVAAALVLLASTAAAQTSPPPDSPNIDLMLFEPAMGSHSFLTVDGADTMSKGQLQLQLGISYATHPFSVYLVDKSKSSLTATRADVVDSLFTGFLSVAYGLTNDIQPGVFLPTLFSANGPCLE